MPCYVINTICVPTFHTAVIKNCFVLPRQQKDKVVKTLTVAIFIMAEFKDNLLGEANRFLEVLE